jgi:GT2 family glycosyltransferase
MISVVIVNYHSAREAERAIRSVTQSGTETEIIVVDNSCTDQEREALEAMQREHGCRLIFNDENVGFAKACNQAFSVSKGSYLFLLNPDAFVSAPCLVLLRDFLEKTPAAGSASPQVYWDDDMRYLFPCYSLYAPLQDFLVRLSSLSRTFRTAYSLAERRRNVGLWKSLHPVKVKNLHGGAVMIRRSAAEQAGGLFDERFFLFFEDTDLFLRMRKKGFDLYVVPEAKAVHNYGHSEKKMEFLTRMSRLYHEKHFSRSLLSGITSRIPEGAWKGEYHDYGFWNDPPSFAVPEPFRDGEYLFEWSSNALFIPSIGCFGKGGEFTLSRQVWDLLDNGRYYCRFSPDSRSATRHAEGYWMKQL